MADLFLKIVNMSISASWIVLAVLLLRIVLNKAPKWINCILWGIVGLRLIMPLSLESVFSLIPSPQTISPEIMTNATPEINTGIPILNSTINPVISDTFAPEIGASANSLQILIPIISVVWLIGIASLLVYTLISYLRLKNKVSTAVRFRDNIYQSEAVVSPFVLGIIRPKIYLPFNMAEQEMEHVIAHEQAHLRRKDHLWKPLGFIILTLHWFNPVMWLAYILLCRDIELACDEKVVKEFDYVQKADYSQALLACSVNRRMVAACPLAFGEVGVKDRVKSVLNYKKPAFWVIVVAIIASIVAAVCFLTNPIKESTLQKGYYKTEMWVYHERAIEGTPLNTYYINGENELNIAGNEVDGTIKKTEITAKELKSYAKKPEAWLSEYNFGEIEEAYTVSTSDEPTSGPIYFILKTESDDILFATMVEDISDETATVKLVSLQKLRRDKEENNIVLTEEEKLDRAITEALRVNAPVYFGKQPMFTTESFSILAINEEWKQTDLNTRLLAGETVAILYHRNSYNYENGQLIESVSSNTAILSFDLDEGDNYTLREFSEFKKDEPDSAYAKTFHLMVNEDSYNTEELGNSLTYDCREKAIEYFGIANWIYAPTLSATFHYASLITFSLDYDKAELSCSGGTMVKENYKEANEYNTKFTYEKGESPIWCPFVPNDDSIKGVAETEITFRLYKKGRMICKGKMTARAQENFTALWGTMYIFELTEADKTLIMQNGEAGPIIRLSDYSNEIIYYKLPTVIPDLYRTEIAHQYLESSQIERLNEITDKAKWKHVELTEIKNLTADGEFRLSDGKTYYFCDETNSLYSSPYLTEISSEDMNYIMYLQTIKVYKVSTDNSSFAQLWLYSSDNHFEFTHNALSSKMYYGEYEDTGEKIICRDRNTESFFTFKKSKGTLIFDEKNSSPLPKYNGVSNLEDGAIFTQ